MVKGLQLIGGSRDHFFDTRIRASVSRPSMFSGVWGRLTCSKAAANDLRKHQFPIAAGNSVRAVPRPVRVWLLHLRVRWPER